MRVTRVRHWKMSSCTELLGAGTVVNSAFFPLGEILPEPPQGLLQVHPLPRSRVWRWSRGGCSNYNITFTSSGNNITTSRSLWLLNSAREVSPRNPQSTLTVSLLPPPTIFFPHTPSAPLSSSTSSYISAPPSSQRSIYRMSPQWLTPCPRTPLGPLSNTSLDVTAPLRDPTFIQHPTHKSSNENVYLYNFKHIPHS